MEVNVPAFLMSAIAGIAIHIFFKFIRRHGAPEPIKRVSEYSGYLSVSDYVSTKRQRRLYYLVFRHLPPLIVLILLCGVLNKAYSSLWTLPYLLAAVLISHLFSTLRELFRRKIFLSERIIHMYNVGFSVFSVVMVEVFSHSEVLAAATPSLEGIVDNIWSSLFVSLIVVAFLESSTSSAPPRSEERHATLLRFVTNSLIMIEPKFGQNINSLCGDDFVLSRLLRSIIIFEDMNRPSWCRALERFLVRLPFVTLTVGIAQVRSNRTISDVESIRLAYELLADNSDTCSEGHRLECLLYKYNPDQRYVENVSEVYQAVPAR